MRLGMYVGNLRGCFTKVIAEVDVLSIFLLFILAVIVFYPLFYVGFTTRDDADIAMNFGWSTGLFESSRFHAENQGRFSFFWGYPLLRLPYVFDSNFWFFITKFGQFFLLLIAIYYAVNRLFQSSWIALVSLLFYLAFIQNGWDHNALTSYPVAFNMYAILFLFSLGLFSKAIDQKNLALAVLSGVLYFFSIGIELFVLFFPLYIFVLMSRAKSGETVVSGFVASRKYILAIAIPLTAYLAIYLVWRNMHPSVYDGNSLNGFNLLAASKVVMAYSFSAFPLASIQFMLSPEQQMHFSNTTGLRQIFNELNPAHFIKPAVVGFLFVKMMTTESFIVSQTRTLIIGAALTFIGIFLPNFLLGFVQKHQVWVASGSYSYLYTYYSFISAVIFAALIAAYLNIKSRSWQPKLRLAMILMAAVVMMALSFSVEMRNQYIAFDQKLSHRKWQLMDAVIKSPSFVEIPDGSTIVAPTLSMHHRGIAVAPAEYWSKYVKFKAGKNVTFVEDKCNIGSPCYSLVFRQEIHSDNQFIVLAKITNSDILASSDMAIYSMPNQLDTVITGYFLPSDFSPKLEINGVSATNVGNGLFSLTLPHVASEGYIQSAKITGNTVLFPDQITVSHYAVVPRLQPFSIKLGEGFYGWETSPDQHKWAWSKGVSTLEVHSYGRKAIMLKVKFEATSLEKIDLHVFGGGKKSFKLVPGIYQPVEFEFLSQPGTANINLIPDHQAINPGGSDSRFLSFSIRKLQVESQ